MISVTDESPRQMKKRKLTCSLFYLPSECPTVMSQIHVMSLRAGFSVRNSVTLKYVKTHRRQSGISTEYTFDVIMCLIYSSHK